MKADQQVIVVNGVSHRAVERAGIWKADMNGHFGWTSVWADTLVTLERRIRQARSGGQ